MYFSEEKRGKREGMYRCFGAGPVCSLQQAAATLSGRLGLRCLSAAT